MIIIDRVLDLVKYNINICAAMHLKYLSKAAQETKGAVWEGH